MAPLPGSVIVDVETAPATLMDQLVAGSAVSATLTCVALALSTTALGSCVATVMFLLRWERPGTMVGIAMGVQIQKLQAEWTQKARIGSGVQPVTLTYATNVGFGLCRRQTICSEH